jgi:hypothetical protein
VETYFAYNFAKPSNGITNFRGYDNRHDTFSITNAALGATFEQARAAGKVMLQIGSTPSTEYLAEPNLPGSTAANASNTDLWKFIQEAYVGYKFPLGSGLLMQAGVFLTPIGPESLAVKDDWNWSRSNLFFGLPSYITGARASYDLDDHWSFALGLYNGWNSVVDNNRKKSLMGNVNFHAGKTLSAQLLYFGGDERPKNAPEGSPWRNLFDLFGQVQACDWLSFIGHFDAGVESTEIGTASWFAGALYARARTVDWLFIALRGDRFWENVPSVPAVVASPLFWAGSNWVSEGTVTVEARPTVEPISLWGEYRHDQSQAPIYFRGAVAGIGTPLDPFVPNSKSQDTLLIGAVGWF